MQYVFAERDGHLVTQSCPTLCDPMVRQAALSMEYSRQESWSGLPVPPPEDFPDPGIKPRSTIPQADSLPSEPSEKHAVYVC